MARDILAQDIVVDEPTDLTDDDVDLSVAPDSANTTLQYLLSRDGLGRLSSLEIAFQADFVQATASAGKTITSVAALSAWTGSVIIGNHDSKTGTSRRISR
ncbi:hypothetical protein [Mesorhizobium sp. B1-1-8]|uniref:hypothetical protein n=1 Tax=Mesorhizobium sp. B1-1-8 TaxID=2589976 RepID=UPI001126E5E3|nr:hypothetical protein [Mesorhizobium sp. B1-1-8]UCI05638.1 hypothetical protein FJ974_17530 [Mesorhizobium sp. B1-1-8]